MRGFVVFLCYWTVSSAYILRQEKDEEWKTRKTLQNKAYTTERREQTARRTIWTQNLKKIAKLDDLGYSQAASYEPVWGPNSRRPSHLHGKFVEEIASK